jgi:hypothetical protein
MLVGDQSGLRSSAWRPVHRGTYNRIALVPDSDGSDDDNDMLEVTPTGGLDDGREAAAGTAAGNDLARLARLGLEPAAAGAEATAPPPPNNDRTLFSFFALSAGIKQWRESETERDRERQRQRERDRERDRDRERRAKRVSNNGQRSCN